MIKNFFKIAWRNLLKHKVTSAINIVGLAVGMAVAIMIGLWIYDEVSYNKYHKNYNRLAQLMSSATFNGQTNTGEAIAIPLKAELENNFGADFSQLALCSWNFEHILSVGDKKIIRKGLYAEPVLPKMLSLEMISGDYETALREPASIILDASTAKTLFGDANPLNRIIKVDNRFDVKVTGVFKDPPHNSSFYESKCYMPWTQYVALESWVKNAYDQWGNHSFRMFAQISENVNIQEVSKKIRDAEKKHSQEGNPQVLLHPMSRWHLYSEFRNGINTGGRIQFVWLFGIIGVFVLLLACINFMNLSTARSEKRAREVGIRKSLGSLRWQLVGQFLTESLLIVLIASVIAIAFTQLALPWFNQLAGKQMNIPRTLAAFWLALVMFVCMTGIVAGSYPAFYLSSFRPLKVLKGTFRAGRWAAVPRKVLVVLQFTVSVALIIGTIVVFKQVQHAKNRPVGYSREALLYIMMNSPDLYGHYNTMRDDLLNTGAVYEMSQSSSPTTGIWSNLIGFDWDGKDPNFIPEFGFVACSHDYGKTVGWEVIAGRDFSRDFGTDSAAIILNEAAVALTGIKNIVGKTIRQDDEPYTVKGVVKNMIMESPWEPPVPTVYRLNYQWASVINIKLNQGIPVQDALKKVETVFAKYNPGSPFEYKFADEEYDAKFRAEERIGKLARVFAILAVFISCLGLLGLSAYVAEQRTREIGIRKVLGASVTQLWMMLSKDFVLLIIISCAIATPVTLYLLNNWLNKYEYRVEPGWTVFAFASVITVIITLCTVSYQAIKAALANPVKSLRTE